MEQDNNHSGDREVDAVLRHASRPPIPAGAMDRLMARIAEEPQQARVIAFVPRARRRATVWRYAAAVPLAASLALGVWLGANGRIDFLMPSAVTGGVALNDDAPVDDLGGVGDAYAEEGTT
ncbi:hypothetical protein DK847_04675 [Aestuariivirga litoralis]|uniref:Uncharacterized protein n=1 Tax=Aestuariivirga litoralis TaxID=2650924 RepID=A0A2W2AQR1_9HYPH|nr:hypothetical protein [Aestuariivirga litoralis]PZF77731.1 hypothetical protein DK847_04675 [Aestuariivirga litoralis]